MSDIEIVEDSKNLLKHLIFRVGGQYYASPITAITEVVEPQEITSSPNSPKDFLGVINLRGEIVSVVDFRIILKQTDKKSPKMLLIIVSTENGKVAALVDELIEVHDFEEKDIDRNPNLKTDIPKSCLTGVAKYHSHIVYLMDLTMILSGKSNQEAA